MRNSFFVILGLFVAVIFATCEQGTHADYKQSEYGFYYKFYKHSDEGIKADSGNIVKVSMRWRTSSDTVYDTKFKPGLDKIIMESFGNSPDLDQMLGMLKEGDSATFIMKPDSFFHNQKPPELDKVKEFFIDVKVNQIQEMEKYKAQKAQERRAKLDQEKIKIREYLKSHNIHPDTTSNGVLIYNHREQSSGQQVKMGKVVELMFRGKLLNGDIWQKNNWSFHIVGDSPDYPIQWDQALCRLSEGDSANFLIPSEKAFGERGYPRRVPPFTPVIMEVKVLDVLSRENHQQQQLAWRRKKRKKSRRKLKNYLSDNNITTEPSSSGLIYITLKEGRGSTPSKGDTAMVHYKGSFLNGEVFDSSYDRGKPFPVIIGKRGLIEGWQEAIPKMQVGEKAKIIVPWRLAYGPQGSEIVPPYANLVFELELVKIK